MDLAQFDGHTPGPWECILNNPIAHGDVVTSKGDVVARIRGWGWLQKLPDGAAQQDANGLLVAAAPDLLAEVRRLTAEADALRRERDTWKAAYDAWQPAGTYVQGLSNASVLPARMLGTHCGDALVAFVERLRTELARKEEIRADAVQSMRLQADMIDKLKLRLTRAHGALEEIALAGMSGTGQESPEAMTDWHARRAWEFIGIASRALWPELAPAAAPERAERLS